MSGFDVDVLVLDQDRDPVTELAVDLHEGNAIADVWKSGTLNAHI